MVFGGDHGKYAGQTEALADAHPGFSLDVLAYHTITDTWAPMGTIPVGHVTTTVVPWGDRLVIPSGEIQPGIRSPSVYSATPRVLRGGFAALDFLVLGAYLAALVGMGFYFSKRENSTHDFFLGGNRVPWWAAGLSIFGTQLSAITFMAIPAKAYATDWVYIVGNLMIVAVAPVVVYLYLPFFRQLKITSAYEYLEQRFNLPTRLVGSAAFILFQFGRMGVVLYLPSLALATVTGVNIYACILIMGILATLYTVLGGIEAVIWTDVIQVVVLVGGALLSVVLMAKGVDGGFGALVAEGRAAGKFHAANLSWDVTTLSLWVIVVGAIFQNMVSYTSDQTVVQRYLTTPDQKSAARAVWTNAWMTIPASILFYFVGTALWGFYSSHPDLLNPAGRTDDIFPWFIAEHMPAGLAGLVIAGLFAAAMSSLDSSLNSMATAITTDWVPRFKKNIDDHAALGLARRFTVALGVIGTGSAAYMAYLQSTSMLDTYFKIIGLFGGSLAGLFAAGIFTRRASGASALLGFFVSAGALYLVKSAGVIHFYLYAFVGIFVCFLVAWAGGFVIPNRKEGMERFTVYKGT
jgi:SSS family transporter